MAYQHLLGTPVSYARRIHYKFWVYILCGGSGTLNVGIAGFFERRIWQHKYDSIDGFTRKYHVHRLLYCESYQGGHAAIQREKPENRGQEMQFREQGLGRIP